jgi:hypothetical protein
MSVVTRQIRTTLSHRIAALVVAAALPVGLDASEAAYRFEKSYAPGRPAHLAVSNFSGEITAIGSPRKDLFVRASAVAFVPIEERVAGDSIELTVRQAPLTVRAEFEILVPSDTSLTLKNKRGKITVQGLTGHVTVDSGEGDVRLTQIGAPSVEVKVLGGDVFFDGDFPGAGPYTFQSMRGDIDLTVPSTTSFSIAARALKQGINLSDFPLNQFTQQSRSVYGTHLRGGPRLAITAYDGHILLHKK